MHTIKLIIALCGLTGILQGMVLYQVPTHDLLLRESYAWYEKNRFSQYYEGKDSAPTPAPSGHQARPSQIPPSSQPTLRQQQIQRALATNLDRLELQEKKYQAATLIGAVASIAAIAGTSLYTWHTLTHATPETHPNALNAIRLLWGATGTMCAGSAVILTKWFRVRNKIFATEGMCGAIALYHPAAQEELN